MRLAKLKISGFKSFSDKTEVVFPPGITAVVGPNGCGKSNIGDALNWVLGEQSPKNLRGKLMADVIFSGSAKRKPLGMAEVTLCFEETEGLTGSDGGNIAITRRLFRSGESDYQINGKRARLMDIQEILEQGRVGARSYATIEQGRIDQILNAKPKERRMLIEDAAGISGYKHKRRLTELKLEATHANLLRVNDIVVEVERQIRSLKRQAGKARRYRTLREDLRGMQQLHFGLRARQIDADLLRLGELQRQAVDAESQAAAGLGRREVGLVDEREALEQANGAYRESAESLHHLELNVDRAEHQVKACSEKIEESTQGAIRHDADAVRLQETRAAQQQLCNERQAEVSAFVETVEKLEARLAVQQQALEVAETRLTTARNELEDLRRSQFESMNRCAERRNRLSSMEEALGRNRAQGVRLREEKDAAHDDLNRLQDRTSKLERDRAELGSRVELLRRAALEGESTVAQAREAVQRHVDELSQAREREKAIAGRLHALEDVATRFAGVSDGVRTLLAEGPAAGVRTHGVIADFVRAQRDVEAAAEGYLGQFLPTVILEDDADVERATRLLREAGAGRTTLVSRSRAAGAPAVGVGVNGNGDSIPAAVLADPRVHGRLRDRLDLATSLNGVLANRVGDAVLVDRLSTALELHSLHAGVDYLTRDGDVVYASGVVATGGAARGDQGLLAHTRQMEEAGAEASRETEAVRASQLALDHCRAELAELEAADRGRREELALCERSYLELEMQGRHANEEHERTGKRDSVLADELTGVQEEREHLETGLAAVRLELTTSEERHRGLEGALQEQQQQLSALESEARRLSDVVSTLRAERAGLAERRESLEQEARRIAEALLELEGRVEALRAEAGAARYRCEQAAVLKEQTQTELITHLRERETLAASTQEMERQIEARRAKLGVAETELREVRHGLEELREATRHAELERTRAESDRAHLDETCQGELGVVAADAALDLEAHALETANAAELAVSIDEVKRKIEQLGPVNMTAIEEFSELEERHGFLSSQKQDLEDAMAKLRDTIRRINRTSRERFKEAFDAIRASYQEVFQVLFNGGRADLILEDEEDILDCGIEIMVQPPGKRLGTVQLMSGGEKALSAVALLFSIFRYQPSPFCLLDEVDAPLDDSNVSRFARLVQEYSKNTQFIIVTHNKLSMEVADLIYGVTMQEPGVSRVMSLKLQDAPTL